MRIPEGASVVYDNEEVPQPPRRSNVVRVTLRGGQTVRLVHEYWRHEDLLRDALVMLGFDPDAAERVE